MPRTAFFAYPSVPPFVGDAIADALPRIDQSDLIVTPWPKLDVQGLKIDDLIRERIEVTCLDSSDHC